METFVIDIDHRGKGITAFEIENIYLSTQKIAGLLKKVEGVKDIRLTGHFGSVDDTRVVFKYLDVSYIVWEPYGDNSRYWIGPENRSEESSDISAIENAFKTYCPPFHRKILGTILTLRLFKRR